MKESEEKAAEGAGGEEEMDINYDFMLDTADDDSF